MYALDDQESDVIDYDDLVDEMVEQGYLRERERERFKTQMHHSHLPRMEESGLIQYDERSETIRRIPDEDVDELLAFIEQFED